MKQFFVKETKIQEVINGKRRVALYAIGAFFSNQTGVDINDVIENIINANFHEVSLDEALAHLSLLYAEPSEDLLRLKVKTEAEFFALFDASEKHKNTLSVFLEKARTLHTSGKHPSQTAISYDLGSVVDVALEEKRVGTDYAVFLKLHDYIVSLAAIEGKAAPAIPSHIEARLSALIAYVIIENVVKMAVGSNTYSMGINHYNVYGKNKEEESELAQEIKRQVAFTIAPYIGLLLRPDTRQEAETQISKTQISIYSACCKSGVTIKGKPDGGFTVTKDQLKKKDNALVQSVEKVWGAEKVRVLRKDKNTAPSRNENKKVEFREDSLLQAALNNHFQSNEPALPEALAEKMSNYLKTAKGNSEKLAKQIIACVAAEKDVFAQYKLINVLDGIFHDERYLCEGAKRGEVIHRSRVLKNALVKCSESDHRFFRKFTHEKLHWKDALLGLTAATRTALKSKYTHGEPEASMSARFYGHVPAQPEIYGGVVVPYVDALLQEDKQQIMEESCFSNEYKVDDTLRMVCNAVTAGAGQNAMLKEADARAAYHAGKTAERLIRVIATRLHTRGRLTEETLRAELESHIPELYALITESAFIKQKYFAKAAGLPESGSCSFLISAFIEAKEPFFVACNMGSNMMGKFTVAKQQISTVLSAKGYEYGMDYAPVGKPWTYTDILPDIRSGKIEPGNIFVLMTPRMVEALPHTYRIEVPSAALAEESNLNNNLAVTQEVKTVFINTSSQEELMSLLAMRNEPDSPITPYQIYIDPNALEKVLGEQSPDIQTAGDLVYALKKLAETVSDTRAQENNAHPQKDAYCVIAYKAGEKAFTQIPKRDLSL